MKLLLWFALLLAGCASQPPLSQTPVTSIVVPKEFRALASCSYARLDRSQGVGIKKIDLPASIRLALESGGVRYWELVFTDLQRGQTRVEYTTVQTVWGADLSKATEILADVQACA